METAEFLRTHRWDDNASVWVMRAGVDAPTGVKPRAEVKAERDLTDPVVEEKARAARAWVANANQFAAEGDGKQWGYALLSEREVTESLTLAGLFGKAA